MTELDDRLRAAFAARADEIPLVAPPLELKPSRRKSGSAGRRRRAWLRSSRWWLPPLAAALAIVVVVVVVLGLRGGQSPPTAPAGSAPIQTTVPRYYVAITADRAISGYPYPASVATVRATATGTLLATVRPPAPYTGFSEVSGATDDRTFVLLADTRPAIGTAPQNRLYLLHIHPSAASAARRAQLTALPASFVPSGADVATMALSPDGRALAAILTPRIPSQHSLPDATLTVDYLATGVTRTWTRYVCARHKCQQAEFGLGTPGLQISTLTWSQNGKSLAFMVGPGVSQLRLLDLHAAGGNAQADSAPFPVPGVPVAYWTGATITPDARSAYVSYRGLHGLTVFGGLVRYSTRTGQLTALNLLTFRNGAGYEPYGVPMPNDVVWTSYNGSQAIVLDSRPGQTAGVYTGTRYTPLPWPANILDAAW